MVASSSVPGAVRRVSLAAGLLTAAFSAAGCIQGSPPTLEPEAIPAAVAGQYYEVAFTAQGGDPTVQAVGLPSGLELWSGIGAGLLFGTPQSEGTYVLSVTAGSGGPTMFTSPARTERSYSLVVQPAGDGDDAIGFEYAVFLDARSGEPFSFNFCSDAAIAPFETPAPGGPAPSSAGGECVQGAAVSGGQPPYRFTLYCLKEAAFCDNPADAYNSPPDGFTLTAGGLLSGTSSSSGRWKFIVCAIDQRSDHACGRTELDVGANVP